MKTKGRRLLHRLSGVLMGVAAIGAMRLVSAAAGTDALQGTNAGAAVILDADLTEKTSEVSGAPASHDAGTNEEKDDGDSDDEDGDEESGLVMANVQNAVNVREAADEESDKVGILYSDCGGEILERHDGWTKLKSGNVTGWTKDEYLLFGEEAKELAEEVGNLIATVEADALRVRKEPEADAGVYGLIGKSEELEAVEKVGEDWVSVDYEGDIGYVAAEYVSVRFVIGTGETIGEIRAREEKELEAKRRADEEKAKQTENLGAVAVEAADDVLLAALIQCEAGGQPYEGQLAVGAVVMNRVRSGGYPDTVSGVIYAPGQFPPATSGAVAKKVAAGVKASCLQAAQEAIAGATNVGGATHFRRAGKHDGIVIGNHVFW